MIFALLLSLLTASANAEIIRLKGGTNFQGTITKTNADSIEVRIKKEIIDPDDYVVSNDTSTSAHAGIIVLKDGSNLHGIVMATDADTVTLQVVKRLIEDIDYSVVPGTSTSRQEIQSVDGRSNNCPQGQVFRDNSCYPINPLLGRKAPIPQNQESQSRDIERPLPGSRSEFHVNVGGFIPLAKLSIQGSDNLAGPGYAFGAQYFRQTGSRVSPGLEIEKLAAGQHNSPTLITNGNTNSQFDSVTLMALIRLSPAEGDIRRYVIAGIGFHSTSIEINSSPQAGFAWTDTHTTETRSLVNSTKSALAFTLQAGANFMINDSVSYGVGVAYYYLASTTYSATPAAQLFGLEGIRQSISGIDLTGNFALRF